MSPAIAKVKHISELLAKLEAGQVEPAFVQNGVIEVGLWVGASDARSVTEFELV